MLGMIWKIAWIIPWVLARSKSVYLQEYCIQSVGNRYSSLQGARQLPGHCPHCSSCTIRQQNIWENKMKQNKQQKKPKNNNKKDEQKTKHLMLMKTKSSIRFLWSKQQKEGEGRCQAALAVITAITWLGITGTRRNSFVMWRLALKSSDQLLAMLLGAMQ